MFDVILVTLAENMSMTADGGIDAVLWPEHRLTEVDRAQSGK